MPSPLELHPLCTLFPRLSGGEFDSLKTDIAANGLRQPIVTHEGMILDGGNRYRACLEAGIAPQFTEFEGANLVSFVLSANLHRRHLSPGQQAAIVASAQDWAQAQGHGGMRRGDQVATLPLETIADRAAQSGASERTQRMADKVAKADPELARKVAHGEISLPKAVEQINTPERRSGQDQREVTPADDPNEYELAEASSTIVRLSQENDALRDQLAVGAMEGSEEEKTAAAETISDLRQQVKALEAELAAVKSSRDKYQRENAEMKSQMQRQRKDIDKLKSATPAA